jgi:uncharacterized protein involved in type VI secretion and phage assembly
VTNRFTDFGESLTGQYETHEFVVQYRETDFNFVSRLDGARGHLLLLHPRQEEAHDGLGGWLWGAPEGAWLRKDPVPHHAGDMCKLALSEFIDGWQIGGKQIRPGAVVLKDFNFETPKAQTARQSVSAKSPRPRQVRGLRLPGRLPA